MSAVYQFALKLACKAAPKMERCMDKFLADNTQCMKGNPYLTTWFPQLLYKRIFGDSKINMQDYLLDQSEECLLPFQGLTKYYDLKQYDVELMHCGGYLAAAIGTVGIIYIAQKLIRKYCA